MIFSRGFFGWELWKFYEIKKSWDFDWNSVGFLMFLTDCKANKIVR
jgi:hypothetical protein